MLGYFQCHLNREFIHNLCDKKPQVNQKAEKPEVAHSSSEQYRRPIEQIALDWLETAPLLKITGQFPRPTGRHLVTLVGSPLREWRAALILLNRSQPSLSGPVKIEFS